MLQFNWVGWTFVLLFVSGTFVMLASYFRLVQGSKAGRQRLIDSIDLPRTRELRAGAFAARYGHKRDIDFPEAKRLLREAYSRGDKLAGMQLQRLLYFDQGMSAARESERIFHDCRDALFELVKLSHPEANFLFCNTWGMHSMDEIAMMYETESLFEACDAGFVPAWLLRGDIEADPADGCNPEEAMLWYRKAADAGWLAGRTGVAKVLCDPAYGGFDPATGIAMLRECAARTDSHAMQLLARMLLDDELGHYDPEEARQWLARAVKLGEYYACIELAILHRDGTGGPVDIVEARRLLRIATQFSFDSEARKLLSELDEPSGTGTSE
ncbi:sel1 repeat family protein [bacterium]|nr:sel1 repeat family protein [bacterium]